MSLETSRINKAEADQALVESIKEVFRAALLGALSEARAQSLSMEPHIRDALIDGLTKEFHPDGNCSDLFSNAFHAAEELANDEIEMRTDELAFASRQAAE